MGRKRINPEVKKVKVSISIEQNTYNTLKSKGNVSKQINVILKKFGL